MDAGSESHARIHLQHYLIALLSYFSQEGFITMRSPILKGL